MEGLASWLVVLVLVVLAAVVASTRFVAERHRAVVTRLGKNERVVGPGLVLHVPLLETLRVVSLRTQHVVLAVPAVTRDGVAVHVTGTATCKVVEPALTLLAEPDPTSATTVEVEASVARALSHLLLADVLPARQNLERTLLEEVNATTAEWGARIVTLELSDFETRLTTELLNGVRGHSRQAGA